MAKVNYLDAAKPNVPGEEWTLPGYSVGRGKVLPKPKAAWDQKDANGRGVDYESGTRLLDESLKG